MLTQPTSAYAWPADVTPPNGVLVASGYGLRISVWRGRLRVDDGVGSARRSILIHRATGRLRRLVVIGHTGSVSLEALRWLADTKAAFAQVDADGRVLLANGPLGTDRPALRRAQAKALHEPTGLEVARWLVLEKIAGQLATLERLSARFPVEDAAFSTIDEQQSTAATATTPNELRTCEGRAAAAYWSAWNDLPVSFARRDQGRVPAHWRTFGTRSSPLTGGPRLAVNPANALLSYLYAILETETTIACRAVGLDPGLGIFHVDQDNRESLAADLMEPLRPVVDRYLIDLLGRRTFAASDFHETSAGACRLTASLPKSLWAVGPELGARAGRVAEDVAAHLDPITVRTPVTGRRRQEARPYGRLRSPADRLPAATGRTCRWCGVAVDSKRLICDECAPAEREQRNAGFSAAGLLRLAALRAEGRDPSKREEALEKVRQNRMRRVQERAAWDLVHPESANPDRFRSDILPEIQKVSIRRLAAATGLSLRYCALIRRGERVPHPRWWSRLGSTAGP